MEELRAAVAQNLQALRRQAGMTQASLAEKLNYTDKAVSKWERGESLPDVAVLRDIARLFGVSVDYLLTLEHESEAEPVPLQTRRRRMSNRASITCMSILLVWLIATFAFVVTNIVLPGFRMNRLLFVYAVPASMIVWLVFNSIWFDRRRNFAIISLLMWSLLAAVFLSLLPLAEGLWQLFVIGIPGQAIIILWSRLRGSSKREKGAED